MGVVLEPVVKVDIYKVSLLDGKSMNHFDPVVKLAFKGAQKKV